MERDPVMTDVLVKYANKSTPEHEKVTHLGGDSWTWTRQQVIDSIEARTNTFFTSQAGVRAEVAVVNGANGKYLRTFANGKWTDNLVSLPPCRFVA